MRSYGDHYAYPQYYDLDALKKLIFGENSLLLVAEDEGRLLGTASVVMHVGAHNDLVGEFGRLVVDPAARGKGTGNLLMEGRIEHVQDRLHVGLVENRVVHPFSQKISARYGFAAAGFLPAKLMIDRRENIILYARYFGDALTLRRNHPHVIPEVVPLAELAMRNLQIEPDVIADVASPPYARVDGFRLEQFNTQGYASLLRLERGRVHDREIVGPLRLHYGLFQLRAHDSTYLLAREGDRLAGAIGFARDPVEGTLRVFELISASERPVRFLLEELLAFCRREEGIEYVEIDVTAHSPRMQRTLLELGFLPGAYVPALTFHQVERLDVVKMVYLLSPADFSDLQLAEPSVPMAELVLRQYRQATVDPRIAAAAGQSRVFAELSGEQRAELAGEFCVESWNAGQKVFATGQPAGKLYLILAGEIEIFSPGGDRVAVLGAGDCLGERSLLCSKSHAHAARAVGEVDLAVLTGEAMEQLVRRRPDIGVVLYRNLACELAAKLSAATGP